jgi:transposase
MKGKAISEDLAWTIVRMAPLVGLAEIEAYTSVSKAQIKRILARWRTTGSVNASRDTETRGRPRHLTPEDVNVCFILIVMMFPNLPGRQFIQGTVGKKCDTYLDELQESLRDNCGVEASLQTVWRALKRSGYSMKKVCVIASMDSKDIYLQKKSSQRRP